MNNYIFYTYQFFLVATIAEAALRVCTGIAAIRHADCAHGFEIGIAPPIHQRRPSRGPAGVPTRNRLCKQA
jgi:hypothetical protein